MEQWVKDDERRMLHAVYRVGDMDATIEYYKKALGMQARWAGAPAGRQKRDKEWVVVAHARVPRMPCCTLPPEQLNPSPLTQLLRYRDIPDEKYTNAFLGYGSERSHFALELTKNYGVDSYDIGDGFGHFGLAVPDVRTTVEQVKAANGKARCPPCTRRAPLRG